MQGRSDIRRSRMSLQFETKDSRGKEQVKKKNRGKLKNKTHNIKAKKKKKVKEGREARRKRDTQHVQSIKEKETKANLINTCYTFFSRIICH